jgi:hypothetical protein
MEARKGRKKAFLVRRREGFDLRSNVRSVCFCFSGDEALWDECQSDPQMAA